MTKQTRTARYEGQEIVAEFTQTFELVDYGAGTKQHWQAMGDIEVTKLEICTKPATMAMLNAVLHDGIMELADECDWVVA